MTRRRLSSDEQELWQKVARSARRMARNAPLPEQPPSLRAISDPKPIRPVSLPARSAPTGPSVSYHLSQDISEQVHAAPLRMDKKTHTRLRRGQMRPEGRIDLHGMTLDQAHPALTRFILNAHAQHKRLVLVITGKGRADDDTGPMPVRRGLLRHAVPDWLGTAPLSSVVIQVTTAHQRHGGHGAYYVYLRRPRV